MKKLILIALLFLALNEIVLPPVSIHFLEGTGRERSRLYFKKTYD